ncbi:MAG: GntR family transcriptional regulator [Pseudonocardia sp.]|uniref:GntR family transcriptional regulator n=1 Tax=Pseudonocardia sp. TaxID=60912 RepID=UPI001AD2D08E|nr:GntR family transcriptional regulator [Pseudonocardia sp.]MBN9098861.1 GntR family transcriptional regulator [Pseudonocardia sp.]
MRDLDPDDPRPPYQQVANALRAAILTRTFKPGDKLPSGPELAKRYGVARMTVQQAIRILRDEGLIVSRQGSGVYVRERTERPVGLRPHLERAFEEPKVSIDFAGFSGETLHGAIAEPIDKVRAGRLRPESIHVRILVPDPHDPWTLPARVDDLSDSPAFRKRAGRIMERHTYAIVDAVNELGELGLIADAHAEIRVVPAVPLFKLYLINNAEAFFGYYPVQEHTVKLDNEPTAMWDLMGKDATLFHHSADNDPDSMASQYIAQSAMWFDSIWDSVAREPAR